MIELFSDNDTDEELLTLFSIGLTSLILLVKELLFSFAWFDVAVAVSVKCELILILPGNWYVEGFTKFSRLAEGSFEKAELPLADGLKSRP